MRNHTLRPQITLGEREQRQLTVLAMASTGSPAGDGDLLLSEMERARIVPDKKLADDIVRMGSTVRYRTDSDQEMQVTLVYPAHADISAGKISVLTPIGAALIGLRQGQSITWVARDGQNNVLTALMVMQPQRVPAAAE